MLNKKNLLIVGLAALTAASLFADDQDGEQLGMQRPPMREITPNAAPRVSNGADVYLTLDFIWWKPRQDGTEFAATGIAPISRSFEDTLVNVPSGRGKVYHPKQQYKPGFKIGAGLDLGHDGWDLFAGYTWLRHNGKTTSVNRTTNPTDLLALWNPRIDFGTGATPAPESAAIFLLPSSASARWKFNLNVFDLDMGRNFYISKYLALRPHFGFKGSWQTQRYSLGYAGTMPDFSSTDDAIVVTSDSMKQKYWGVGMRGGLDTTWYLSRNFSFYGNLSFSGMLSNFKSTRSETGSKTNLTSLVTSTATLISTRDHFTMVTPVIEWSLGAAYETWFSDDNYHFLIAAGWEEQIWGNMNHFFHEQSRGDHGDLSLDGLTIHARFDF